MKNKPQRHKEKNVFKFKSFADRISQIDIRHNALYYIQHVNEEPPEEDETHFHQAYSKWIVLNLTDEYNVFQKKIRNIITLPQLIHNKEFVIDLLLQSLKTATTLSLQPLLEFVIVLAKDLREEFYPHFQSFLECLIQLLKTKDPDQLEWTFICLAYLFKTLKPFLKKDMTIVFNSILPLLDRKNPEHVTNFAAECFSFVARDIKDKEKFLLLVLTVLQKHNNNNNNGIKGCGKLLFEMMKGVNGSLHSCTESFLEILLKSLKYPTKYDADLLFEVLKECVVNLLYVTNPTQMTLFWKVCHRVLDDIIEADDEACNETLQKLLHICGQGIEFRNGKMLGDTTELMITSLVKVFDRTCINDETLMIASQLVAALLLSPNLNISQLDASRVTKKVLHVTCSEVFEAFVWNCVKYSQFELFILPEFLRYFESKSDDMEVLELLTKIVLLKSPLSRNGIDLENWKQFPLRFKKIETIAKIESLLAVKDGLKDADSLIMALIVYPHVLGRNQDKFVKPLTEHVTNIGKILTSAEFVEQKKMFFILSTLIETLIHIDKLDVAVNLPKLIDILLPYCSDSKYLPALNILNQVIEGSSTELTFEQFEKIHSQLAPNLSSQYHQIRLLTTHTLRKFSKLPQLGQHAEELSIYDIFYHVESITSSVSTYREQLLYLQKLAPDMELFGMYKDTICALDPLRYFLGAIYINFNLIWKPIAQLIAAFSTTISSTDFWNIFKCQIDNATEHIRQLATEQDTTQIYSGFESVHNTLIDLFCSSWEIVDRPDYANYRIQLWKMIPSFGNLAEVKNRDLVTMFLNFIDLEYKKSYENEALCWNVLAASTDETAHDDADEPTMEEEEESTSIKKYDGKSQAQHKGTQSSLIAMISVFTHLSNPSQVHRQSELYALFLELLCHRNHFIQKIALDCIMAYKHKYLVPYKDNLYGIIDEQKFKESITTFQIAGEENVVQPEHRIDLMSILMRILYSKMVAKVQKGGGQIRKALVMRFLGNCHENEVLIMLKMAFSVYEPLMAKDDPHEMTVDIVNNINLTNVLSPKKLQSSLNLIEIIREQFGGLMSQSFLRYLLKIIFAIGALTEGVLQVRTTAEKINPGHGKIFKNIRTLCLQSMNNFFNHFDNYPWIQAEIEALFTIFITPILEKLPTDGIHSATPLLKLFSTFGKNPRYFVLLTKLPANTSSDKTPLRYIIDLLLEPKTKPLVCLTIMEMIQNLLQLQDASQFDEQLKPILPIPAGVTLAIERPSTMQNINFGSAAILRYMPKILDKFQQNLKKRRGLTKRDLLIVSKCTELVTDSETASQLLDVLMPILVKKSHSSAGEEALAQMVTTIKNLFEKVTNPEEHIRNIAPMFEQITAVGPRKLLCDLIETIFKRVGSGEREDLKQLSEIVKELNSWDRRWVEQPDYEKRLTAYKRIGKLQSEGKVDLHLALIAVYHSFYFIKHDKDMAMRDSASYHLKSLVTAMAKQLKAKDLDYFIGTVVLNLIRRTFNDKNDNVKIESILLLGELARECPDAHPCLQDLHALTNKNDREIDFFDNITHLQTHRHGRALQRFCNIAKTYDTMPQSRTLTQFILPLASQYLLCEKHAKKHGVITIAIEAIGVVCKLLPWHQYESILKYYLKKMRYNVEYQKQCVRTVMQILDSFHFDLSKAKVAKQEIAETLSKQAAEEEKKLLEEAKNEAKPKIKEIEKETEEVDDEEVLFKEDEPTDELLALDDVKQEDDDEDDGEADEKEDESKPIKKIKIAVYDKPTILSHKAAKRLVHTIATGLIPSLNNSITTISTFESFHKLNKKKRRSEREEEEILRVPIALAMVKLLQKLPDGMLDHTLPGIFIKVCMFLKSPLRSVRMVTRDILKNIMLTVGTKYLDILLHQMTTLLTRGFQVHVLTVTVYSILDALKRTFKAGDVDRNMQSILSVCLEDIFGKTAEEKEIRKIGMHTPEAKPSNKSFLTLHIVAINITESCLLDLLIPFKDNLQKTQSKTVVMKVQECFKHIVMGLVLNKHISTESQLMFIYGTASESIPDLLPGTNKPVLTESEKEKIKRARPDCFLIQEEPRGRTGAIKKVIKTNVRANAHVLVEFGLDMLHILLKRGKLLKINYQPFLDPVVQVLLDSLKSTHIRVTTYALKCLTSMWNREMVLSKLPELVPSIVPQIFSILHKYATAGMSTSNDNYGLVKNAFKAMVALLRYVEYYSIDADQLKILLLYVEQNLHDPAKQTIAFSLLNVVISRKLLVGEMHEVMRKISELVIVSESSVVRQDAKNIMVNYLMDYPLGKKIDGFLKFFVSNLSYELSDGRESAIHILHAIVKRFPQDVLNKKSGYLFLSLGARLINDESSECRALVADCIESLIAKVDVGARNQLFDIVLVLLKDEKISHREMAALLCTRFIVAEKQKFTDRIEKVLPSLISTLSLSNYTGPGQFVRIARADKDDDEDDDDEEDEMKAEQKQRAKDHQIIQALNTLLRIFESYPNVLEEYHQYSDELAYEAQKLLAYEHVWVRLNAAKALDIVLSHLNIDAVQSKLIRTDDEEDEEDAEHHKMDFIYSNPKSELRSLSLDLCAQLIPEVTDNEMAEQVVKNLLYIANLIKVVPFDSRRQQQDADNDAETPAEHASSSKAINLIWLIRRIRYVIHAEVAKAPHSIVLRTAAFHWIEGLSELLDVDIVLKLSPTLLAPVVREMSDEDKNIDPKLRQLALKVGNSIKNKIGEDDYNILRTQIQTKLMIKRAQRKKEMAQVKVRDPVRAAMRKQGEKDRKKVAKKRKMDVIKGRALPKKKKLKRNADDDDFF